MIVKNVYPLGLLIIFVFLSIFLITFGSISYAASISGTVYQSNGTTPVTGTQIQVAVIQGDPCDWYQWGSSSMTNSTDGTYTITGLSPGTYYLRTNNNNNSNYVNEWWANAGSSYDCGDAEWIEISSSGQILTGKNFQLDEGGSISGTVYQSNGTTPVTGTQIQVEVMRGDPCLGRTQWLGDVTVNSTNGTYTVKGAPIGPNYLMTNNNNNSNYVNEWWASAGSSYDCGVAESIEISSSGQVVTGKNFQLDEGGSISGTVYQSNGTTPVSGTTNIEVQCIQVNPCEWPRRNCVGGSHINTSNGTYTAMGVPTGINYLKTQNFSQFNYIDEWWAQPASTYKCNEAQAIDVSQGGTYTGKDFQLDEGGSLTGVVVDENSVGQRNVRVQYSNRPSSEVELTITDTTGRFTFYGCLPGPDEVSITPEINTGLAHFNRKYWLETGENKDLGTITLYDGALISGVLKNASSIPLANIGCWYGGKYWISLLQTKDTDGSFEFRLPIGNYTLNVSENSGYCMVPVQISVPDVSTPINLGDKTAYDASTGDTISGTVTAGPSHHGDFGVIASLNNQQCTPDNFGGFGPLGYCEPDDVSGNYSLFVPPGNTIVVALLLFSEDENSQESVTVVDTIEGITTPSSGRNLTYSSEGYTVDGFVKKNAAGIFYAQVLLYKQPGDKFAGFAETDNIGKYIFYNVQAGTYRIGVSCYDYDTSEWSDNFDVSADVTVPDIRFGSLAMPWVHLLLLGD
jgi:hypothetical protein